MTLIPATTSQSKQSPSWRLWVDRGGGFDLRTSPVVNVGGARPGSQTHEQASAVPSEPIQVISDWRRREGQLARRDGDYFWIPADEGSQECLISDGQTLPINGSAKLRLSKPSILSGSVVLSLEPPHRFAGHVDATILVEQTILIGPTADQHIRCSWLVDAVVLVFRDGSWQAKQKLHGLVPVPPGERVSLGELDLTLEET